VRHLRNALESAAAQSRGGALQIRREDLEPAAALPDRKQLFELPYKFAKEAVLDGFTREYLEALLARHKGNVSAAAREAELDRNWIVELAQRLGVPVR
jgi:DNA-binding NtrC family response regulator